VQVFRLWVRVKVFNATFNNISVMFWQSVLLVEETGENNRSVFLSVPVPMTATGSWNMCCLIWVYLKQIMIKSI
jgi:hypothetical protein